MARVGNTSAAFPIARFDYAIDENNVDVVTPPDPEYKQKPRFVGNMHNRQRLRPCGFFRKVPSLPLPLPTSPYLSLPLPLSPYLSLSPTTHSTHPAH